MPRSLTAGILVAALVALSTGCQTMPVPKSGQDTALAIPVRLQRENVDEIPGEFRIRITSKTDPSFKRVAVVSFANSFHLVAGLPAGSYVLAELSYWFANAPSPAWTWEPERPVLLPAGTLTILPYSFAFRLYHENNNKSRRMIQTSFEELTDEMALRILTRLSGLRGFDQWKLSDATAGLSPVRKALETLRSGAGRGP